MSILLSLSHCTMDSASLTRNRELIRLSDSHDVTEGSVAVVSALGR
jgi:hypothetical protein